MARIWCKNFSFVLRQRKKRCGTWVSGTPCEESVDTVSCKVAINEPTQAHTHSLKEDNKVLFSGIHAPSKHKLTTTRNRLAINHIIC